MLILLIICSAGVFCQLSYAFDWKSLHELADICTLERAKQALNQNPRDIEKLYVLGLVLFNKHQDVQAKEIFDKILTIDPDNIPAQWALAEFLRRQHELAEAERILTWLIHDQPDFSPAYISIGYIKYVHLLFDETVDLMGVVIDHGKDNVDLTTYVRAHCIYAAAKGMIAYYGGPISKSINGAAFLRHLRIVKNLQPENVLVPYGFGCYYLLIPAKYNKRLDIAEGYFRKALSIDPLIPDIYVRLAEVYNLKGDQDKAKEYIDKAADIDPKNELLQDFLSGDCKFVCGAVNEKT